VTEAAPTIGVDLGGTNLRAALVDADGGVLAEEHEPTPDDWRELVAATVRCIAAVDSGASATAIGVGAAGLIDREGTVHYAPNLPMLREAPLGGALAEALPQPVVVDNDANVAALGELSHGAARGCQHALVITLGTWIGGAIILDGHVYRGAHGFAAEVGHWQFDPDGPLCACGEPGHWEAAASGTALGRMARERAAAGKAPNVLARAGGDVAAVSGVHAGDAAQAGEADGVAIVNDYARAVATGLAGLANVLDPELIVVAGGLIELGDVLLGPIRAEFGGRLEGPEFRPEVPVVAAALGERAGVIGAAALARTAAS
jgi:glucokinase